MSHARGDVRVRATGLLVRPQRRAPAALAQTTEPRCYCYEEGKQEPTDVAIIDHTSLRESHNELQS